ncbi:lysylphosphatidylglycerol synthase transmembrane domain-containing protein [Actinomadura kijaniata]|uniref:lysylphosphatidylglycerol synthase transmembrane domain-containing protein n=1 Tax=Actinomadura kijaniata TaxID=46161 RepID=UPI000834C2EB|nr:lysylphosphatidylglycerol synthase transmembrane domain-containing protein [Actinomadura kijaniata]
METIAAGAERTAPAVPGGGAAPETSRPRARRPRARRTLTAALLLAALATAALLIPTHTLATAFRDTRWEYVPALAALSVLHYVFAALALRGASGRALPLLPTTMAQFTAAAANRLTPGGLGAIAVNTRYLVCHGLPLTRAAVAVAVMQVAGAPADLILLLLILGVDPDDRALHTMGDHAARALTFLPPEPLLAAGAILLAAAALWGRRAARSAAVTRALAGLRDLAHRPRDLLLTVTASAATTFVLGLAFALSALAVPGTGAGPGDVLPFLTAYLVGAAAAAAVPSPGGVGSTEAALTGALIALGVTAAPALQAVLLFRAITFWAPVPIGLLTSRTLRRRPLDPRHDTAPER